MPHLWLYIFTVKCISNYIAAQLLVTVLKIANEHDEMTEPEMITFKVMFKYLQVLTGFPHNKSTSFIYKY